MSEIQQRVETLEEHVLGVGKDNPGILMRLDRQEILIERMTGLVKYMVAGGGLAAVWKIAEAALAWAPRNK